MDAIEEAEMPELRGIRVDIELKEALRAIATRNDRSLTSEVRRALRIHAEQEAERG